MGLDRNRSKLKKESGLISLFLNDLLPGKTVLFQYQTKQKNHPPLRQNKKAASFDL